jgi:ribosomal protein S18 acetylase RimI-like enzyme
MAATEADTIPGVLAIEQAGMQAWPGIEMSADGSWMRRAANGYTQRANSVQPLDPRDDADIDARLVRSREWFANRGLPVIVRLTPLAPPEVVRRLDALGWTVADRSRVMAMQIAAVASDPRAEILDALAPQFLAAQQALQGYPDAKLDRFRALLEAVQVPMAGVVLRDSEGRAVASALWAVADGIAVTGNVITDPACRRLGHARAMMRSGLAWARAQGARFASLNVAADNSAGVALYQSLGYRPQYDYVYRYEGAK